MKPLTELDLRLLLKEADLKTFTVPKGTLVTPSALEYLNQNRIELIYGDSVPVTTPKKSNQAAPKWNFSDPSAKGSTPVDGEKAKLLFFGPDGGSYDHKPEALTHLKGRQLVHKNHPIIIWRGKLDSLTARIVEAQLVGVADNNQEFVSDLQEIIEFIHALIPCEMRGTEVKDFNLLGLDAAALRERSHDPVKFFGHRHMLTTYKMGPLCVALNTLRAQAREAELVAVVAFKDGSGKSTRDDIIRALNRLSSLFYIMMFKYLPKNFVPEHSGI